MIILHSTKEKKERINRKYGGISNTEIRQKEAKGASSEEKRDV